MYLVLSATYLWDLYGISIALVIHSLDHSLFARLRDLLSGFTIAFTIRSVDGSLSTRLIPLGLLEAGAQGISIARAIRLVDRALQMYFSNRL